MTRKRKPRKPHRDCVWDPKNEIWLWPDDRTPARAAADEAIAQAAESGEWEKHGFKIVRSAAAVPRKAKKTRSRTA